MNKPLPFLSAALLCVLLAGCGPGAADLGAQDSAPEATISEAVPVPSAGEEDTPSAEPSDPEDEPQEEL